MNNTNDKMQEIGAGCIVRLFCLTIEEHAEYKMVKSRDTVEYKPQFGTKMSFASKLYYDTVTKFAEYTDDELVEDCPLVKTLIGKKIGDSLKSTNIFTGLKKLFSLIEVKSKLRMNLSPWSRSLK